MALFRRADDTPSQPTPPLDPPSGGGKGAPTLTRKQAEALRRQRSVRTLTKKEARLEASRASRSQRIQALSARETPPERVLMRDFIDARFNLGEIMIPSLVVILALSLLGSSLPRLAVITTLAMYLFILAVLGDVAWMWVRFKRVLAERMPQASTRGLLMYGANRAIQLRRFRMPRPRIERGGTY